MIQPGMWFYIWGYRPRFLTGFRFWWAHRNETPQEFEERVAATKKQFKRIWLEFRKEIEVLPETRDMIEVREHIDKFFEDCE